MGTTDTHHASASLQRRARRLRRQAGSLPPLLADTYRRRAAEVDLQAWLEAVWNPPMDPGPLGDPPGRLIPHLTLLAS